MNHLMRAIAPVNVPISWPLKMMMNAETIRNMSTIHMMTLTSIIHEEAA